MAKQEYYLEPVKYSPQPDNVTEYAPNLTSIWSLQQRNGRALLGVIQCLNDLINSIALPTVAGLPLTTALGVLPFEDKLLDVH